MKRNLPSMSALTNKEMGLDDEADTASAATGVISDARSRQAKQKTATKRQTWVEMSAWS